MEERLRQVEEAIAELNRELEKYLWRWWVLIGLVGALLVLTGWNLWVEKKIELVESHQSGFVTH